MRHSRFSQTGTPSVSCTNRRSTSAWGSSSCRSKMQSTFLPPTEALEGNSMIDHRPRSCPASDTANPWNVACGSVSLNERLSLFSAWRGQKFENLKGATDQSGLWHLMSGCPSGTEVGVAWLGTVCNQQSTGNAPSVVSGTAVSTAGRTEWQVVAHEIGHNFGAIVSFFLITCLVSVPMNPPSSTTAQTTAPSATTAARSPRKLATRTHASSCRPSRRAANKSSRPARSETSAR